MLKIFFLLSAKGFIFVIIFNGCGRETEVPEAPKTGEMTVMLFPSIQEIKGEF